MQAVIPTTDTACVSNMHASVCVCACVYLVPDSTVRLVLDVVQDSVDSAADLDSTEGKCKRMVRGRMQRILSTCCVAPRDHIYPCGTQLQSVSMETTEHCRVKGFQTPQTSNDRTNMDKESIEQSIYRSLTLLCLFVWCK